MCYVAWQQGIKVAYGIKVANQLIFFFLTFEGRTFFLNFIFIFGCVGSSLLRAGFL